MAKRIGELLVEGELLSQAQLEHALLTQRSDRVAQGRKLGQLLVELKLVSELQVTQTLSRQLSVPWVSLYHVDFARSLLNLVPRELAEKYGLIPIFVRRTRKQGETLYVAMDDPTNEAAIQEVARVAALPVKPMIACPGDIRAAIRVFYFGEAPEPPPAAAQVPAKPAPAAPAAPAKPTRKSVPKLAPAAPAAPPSAPAPPPESRPGRRKAQMFSLTLLDGTKISLPSPRKKAGSAPDLEPGREPRDSQLPAGELSDQLTARDLVSALRAVSHGVDASEILGTEPRWEAMFSALLSVLLRKGLIADWEFVEEFRKV